MIAKNTYPTISRPHSKLGLVPMISQPGGRASSADTPPMARNVDRKIIQIRSPNDMDRTSRTSAAPAARGVVGTTRPPRVSVLPPTCIAQASLSGQISTQAGTWPRLMRW